MVEAVVRSFPPVETFAIRLTRAGRALAPDLDPSQLKRSRRGKSLVVSGEEKIVPTPWTPARFAAEVIGRERLIREAAVDRARSMGSGKAQADGQLRQALVEGLVHRHKGNGNEPHRFSVEPPAELTGRAGSSRPPPPVLPAPGAGAWGEV